MGFDELYDQILHQEFGSAGGTGVEADLPAPITLDATAPEPPLAAVRHEAATAAPIHNEFRPHARHAAPDRAAPESEGPAGLSRYRNAAMVGAGGLACAAVGAFLGGFGGDLTINPAAAHPVAAASAADQPLASAVGQAAHGTAARNDAVVAASLSSLSGGLTQGVAPFEWLTSGSPADLLSPTTAGLLADLPVNGVGVGGTGAGSGAGSGSGTGGSGTDPLCSIETDLGLGCILDPDPGTGMGGGGTLGGLGTLASDSTGALDAIVPSLTGLVAVTETLSDLGSLLPITSLPLPASALPTVLSALLPSGSVLLPGGSILLPDGSVLPATATGSTTGTGAAGPATGVLGPVVDGVAAALSGVTSGTGTPALPLPSTGGSTSGGVPALPVTVPSGPTPFSTTTTTTAPTTAGATTPITVPLPALPVPATTPPVTVGGVTVGVSSSGGSGGLTLSLP